MTNILIPKLDCAPHDLVAGDEVQITGLESKDGVHPVTRVGQSRPPMDWPPRARRWH